ncbi:hypothetical protein [Rossellomorea vietnamensis]|uniref:hypothetical protein n=1 Tax=Rossellomorea vietnamensis TaxID=218284 RepID=UPI003D28F702
MNRVIRIAIYWIIVVILLSGNHKFLSNPVLFAFIVILASAFTVHQIVMIRRIERL